MAQIPSVSSYGRYESDNYGVNTLMVSFTGITLYYSYKTVIAYSDNYDGLVVSENEWTVTTGKHLNWIDGGDKSSRVPYEIFQKMLRDAMNRQELGE